MALGTRTLVLAGIFSLIFAFLAAYGVKLALFGTSLQVALTDTEFWAPTSALFWLVLGGTFFVSFFLLVTVCCCRKLCKQKGVDADYAELEELEAGPRESALKKKLRTVRPVT
jgi:hypothetical protein